MTFMDFFALFIIMGIPALVGFALGVLAGRI